MLNMLVLSSKFPFYYAVFIFSSMFFNSIDSEAVRFGWFISSLKII